MGETIAMPVTTAPCKKGFGDSRKICANKVIGATGNPQRRQALIKKKGTKAKKKEKSTPIVTHSKV